MTDDDSTPGPTLGKAVDEIDAMFEIEMARHNAVIEVENGLHRKAIAELGRLKIVLDKAKAAIDLELAKNAIVLDEDGPIVQRAMQVDTAKFVEVGFIPGDKCGCKIYAHRTDGELRLEGWHSRTYGCDKETQVVVLRKLE